MSAIYVYDSRSQYQQPLFVVHDEAKVEKVLSAAFDDVPQAAVHVSYVRLHPYDIDRYTSMGSSGMCSPRVTATSRKKK